MKKDKTIPKIIHYCWFGGGQLPNLALKCIESWKKYCPDYKIIEWNENNFDININKYVKEAYEEKKWAFMTDYIRLYVVYNYGGIYLDTDVELIKSLDQIINCESFFSSENNITISTGLGFGACKKNFLVKRMLDDYENIHFKLSNGTLDLEPCPARNSKSIADILKEFDDRNEVCIYKNNYFYPKQYFCPIDVVSGKLNLKSETIAIHHYSGSWLSPKDLKIHKNRNRICAIFGNKLGQIICKIYTLPHRINNKIKKLGLKDTIKFAFKKISKKS